MFRALIIFVLTYILMLILPNLRTYIALASALVFIKLGILSFEEAIQSIDWNVLMMIAGTMGVVSLFIESKMPNLLADKIIKRVPSVKWTILALSLFAGLISSFVDNVATVLMIAPVALSISKRLGISPVPSIIAISISSNLQGAATLVGDTTAILLGSYADMDFLDFFVYNGKMGMFWIVQIGALASALVLLVVFWNENQRIRIGSTTRIKDYFPTILLTTMVLCLILASFIPKEFTIGSFTFSKSENINGIICMTALIIGIIVETIIADSIKVIFKTIKEIDYYTLLLLSGIFIIVGGIAKVGVIDAISDMFIRLTGDNLFFMYTVIVWASVAFSAFIDNIPYTATMLPIVTTISHTLNIDATVLYFGLLVGATLGGNITPIGASANITGIGILRKEGYQVSTKYFMKISVPFTLACVITGYILVWLIWT